MQDHIIVETYHHCKEKIGTIMHLLTSAWKGMHSFLHYCTTAMDETWAQS